MSIFLKAVGLLGIFSGIRGVFVGSTVLGILTVLAGAYLFDQGRKKS